MGCRPFVVLCTRSEELKAGRLLATTGKSLRMLDCDDSLVTESVGAEHPLMIAQSNAQLLFRGSESCPFLSTVAVSA